MKRISLAILASAATICAAQAEDKAAPAQPAGSGAKVEEGKVPGAPAASDYRKSEGDAAGTTAPAGGAAAAKATGEDKSGGRK